MRSPVTVGSISDITFLTDKKVTVDEINQIFREEAQSDRYQDILGVSADQIVSSDIIADPRASIVDLTMTRIRVSRRHRRQTAVYRLTQVVDCRFSQSNELVR